MATDNHGRTIRRYSGEGQGVANFVLWLVPVVAILASFWLFTMPENWWFVVGILIYGAALMIPTLIVAGKTAKHSTGGRELTLDVPHSTESAPRQEVRA
ncbi:MULTISPECIES: hypothetical protein [Kocuria]|uniref:Uncharacterized protein n=1 Tax=Kocuria subflava TaxID=1736139 RepID=A0A846U707_9MICC|nr:MULTISPECIES: hypothetical protein [Kocuria]NKE09406.1 hypothetical protein [Kocuria subflava]